MLKGLGWVVTEFLNELASQVRAGKPIAVGIAAVIVLLCGATVVKAVSWAACRGPSLSAVEGHVRYDGQLIRQGEVTFTPCPGSFGQRRSCIITNGAFGIPLARGLRQGEEFVVEVRGMRSTGNTYLSQGEMIEELEQYLPQKFNTSSELRIRPTAKKTSVDYNLVP